MASTFLKSSSPVSSSDQSLYLTDDAAFEIILKIQETCNLNCKYCYMYNVGNTLYKDVPPSAPLSVCTDSADIMCHEFETRNPVAGRLILHGGEPLLMPIHRFIERMEAMHRIFEERLTVEQRSRISISLQTNATLVNDAWIDVFERFSISPSVSIDGTASAHNDNRIFHDGSGSHERVLAGLNLLKAAALAGRISFPGGLCVINPNASGEETYRFIVETCGLTNIDFLFPFRDWTNYDREEVARIGTFLTDAFRVWATSGRSNVRVRVFKDALDALDRRRPRGGAGLPPEAMSNFFVVVESDGSIMPDETLRPSTAGRFCEMNASDVRLADILADETFAQMIRQSRQTPSECAECTLLPSCRGGTTLGRYGMRYDGNDYTRKSVFCDAYQELFAECLGFLIAKGADAEALALA